MNVNEDVAADGWAKESHQSLREPPKTKGENKLEGDFETGPKNLKVISLSQTVTLSLSNRQVMLEAARKMSALAFAVGITGDLGRKTVHGIWRIESIISVAWVYNFLPLVCTCRRKYT